MSVYIDNQGFLDLEEELSGYLDKVSNQGVSDILKIGADEFRDDLLRLPSPRSKINSSGHSHLLDTFATKAEDTGWLVGWGKYYGPIIEHGWNGAGRNHKSSHSAIPHFKPTFNSNREKYYKDMIEQFNQE